MDQVSRELDPNCSKTKEFSFSARRSCDGVGDGRWPEHLEVKQTLVLPRGAREEVLKLWPRLAVLLASLAQASLDLVRSYPSHRWRSPVSEGAPRFPGDELDVAVVEELDVVDVEDLDVVEVALGAFMTRP